MEDILVALQVYFIGIVIATVMAGVIRGLQVILGRIDARRTTAVAAASAGAGESSAAAGETPVKAAKPASAL